MRKDNLAKYGPIVWEENTVIHIIQRKDNCMSVSKVIFVWVFLNPGRLGVLGSGRFSKREFFLQKCSVGLVTASGHWNFLAVRISDIYGPRTRRLQTEVLGQIFIVLKYAHRWHCS